MQQQPMKPYGEPPVQQAVPPHNRRPGRARRFFRGYLMVAGAAATLLGLTLLLVSLFVEIDKWIVP